jgi:glycosyltransferase involved in cell wall biosynthesis
VRPLARTGLDWLGRAFTFPLRPMAWARALDAVVEPADVWHGMWGGSLPASLRFRHRFGGRAIYDARDILLHSRGFARLPRLLRAALGRVERRWARRVDAVLSVNDAYADILARNLRIARPIVVMNCPVRYEPPEPRPDLIRDALGLDGDTAVVLYQGLLMSERGIEESMAAIRSVPGAVLALLGFGSIRDRLAGEVAAPPYAGRVFLLDPVPPAELLDWTASADVSMMAIQPTTLNHRFTTPQKLFESLAAGTPIVASDLPGMAPIVRDSGAGLVCDPTDPDAIAAAIRSILELPPAERDAMRQRGLAAAHATYNWAAQEVALRATWDRLLAGAGA